MKGDARRDILDQLVTIFTGTAMKAKVKTIRDAHAGETLPDLAAVYVNEEDYNKVRLTPCILLFGHGPQVLSPMNDAYLWEFPVDICAFDFPQADGLPALYNRLYAYQGCATDLLLSSYPTVTGCWQEVRPLEWVDPQSLADQRFGEMGRVEGFRFGFQVALSYP